MKKILRIFMAAAMVIIFSLFAACDDAPADNGGPATYTVTFSLNYEGADEPYKVEEVSEDEDGFTLVAEPAAPVRENYAFGGWFTDSDCTDAVNFEKNIESNVTYYAKWTMTSAVVTFDPNYDEAETFTQTVAVGGQVSQPASPSREGYTFDTWYTESSCENEYDFTSAVNGDMTLYAGWDEITAEGTVTMTYMFNYENAPDGGVYDAVELAYNKKTTAPVITREGFYFDGWYTEAECLNAFDFGERITEDHTLYAKWLEIYTFEAEMTDLSQFNGYGYSGAITGWNAVYEDRYNGGASNGFYVTGMYDMGISLTFCVWAEEEVDDAYLVLSLSGEFASFSVTDDQFLTTVNGQKVSFGSFSFNIEGLSGSNILPFAEYRSTVRVHLEQGANTIVLTTNNNIKGQGGTVYALAPMVDCIKLYSSAAVTWDTEKGYPHDDYLNKHS